MLVSFLDTRLSFPEELDAAPEQELEIGGLIEGALVNLSNSLNYIVTFADTKYIEAVVESASPQSNPFFGKPGLIVVSRTSSWVTSIACCWAANQDFFTYLQPLPHPNVISTISSITYQGGDKVQILSEANDRGYLDDVHIKTKDGRCFKVAFMVPMRISREIELDSMNGRPFFVEPGLIIVQNFSEKIIQMAVESLASTGFFEHLRPL